MDNNMHKIVGFFYKVFFPQIPEDPLKKAQAQAEIVLFIIFLILFLLLYKELSPHRAVLRAKGTCCLHLNLISLSFFLAIPTKAVARANTLRLMKS